jgi:glycerol kinase
MDDKYILAIDQGTSGTLASLFDQNGNMVASADEEVHSIYPQNNWVEQNPYELLVSIQNTVKRLIQENHLLPSQIKSLGFANQGESLLLWDLVTGEPIYNVISWRCSRSADLCGRLIQDGLERNFQEKTGLPINPEWPATKIPWVIANLPQARELLTAGRLAYSQTDTWFIHQLTKERKFITDHSTASRSGFYNINNREWDADLIRMFGAESLIFPEIVDNVHNFGMVDFGDGWKIPWMSGGLDQSMALFGQGCIYPGDTKITYGTCASLWFNLGSKPIHTKMVTTSVAWVINNDPTYAIVGEVGTASTAIDWLKEKFHMPWRLDELSDIAKSASDQDGLIFVNALNGLGAPYWAPQTRGTVFGFTGAMGLEHLLRACLEAIAFNIRDISDALKASNNIVLSDHVIVDGGMAANDFLMQFQADILGLNLLLPENKEGTSRGIAFLAGLASGFYQNITEIQQARHIIKVFKPQMLAAQREKNYSRWSKLVEQAIRSYPLIGD